jgi:hypothetical protein
LTLRIGKIAEEGSSDFAKAMHQPVAAVFCLPGQWKKVNQKRS